MPGRSIWSRYSFTFVTLGLFLLALAGHWIAGWYAYVNEQQEHGQLVEVSGFLAEILRGTLENWQSEFLQLVWQVAGLSFLLHVGSTQSRESNERLEAKVDELLRTLDTRHGETKIRELDRQFLRKE